MTAKKSPATETTAAEKADPAPDADGLSPEEIAFVRSLRPRVYLAGPDVFRPDWKGSLPALQAAAKARGLEALFPVDPPSLGAAPGRKPDAALVAKAVSGRNMAKITEADCVVANLDSFRGQEPDSGTVYECGFARGLGKPVVGYMSDLRPLIDKAREHPGGPAPGSFVCADGTLVEDFGLPLNVMLASTADGLYPNLEAALDRAAEILAAMPVIERMAARLSRGGHAGFNAMLSAETLSRSVERAGGGAFGGPPEGAPPHPAPKAAPGRPPKASPK